ncbi:hypothetical protein ACWGQT_14650 [Streptomyces yangpuensis]
MSRGTTGPRDEEQLIAQGFRRVYAEPDRYDGPRAGPADVHGSPHCFRGYDCDHADAADEYLVRPASEAAVAPERAQWAIFTDWNRRHEGGGRSGEPPGPRRHRRPLRHADASPRRGRQSPADARRLVAEPGFDADDRYRADGPDQWFRWHRAG